MKQQIEQEYNSKIMNLSSDDPCFDPKQYTIDQKSTSKLDAIDSMIAKIKRKNIFKNSE